MVTSTTFRPADEVAAEIELPKFQPVSSLIGASAAGSGRPFTDTLMGDRFSNFRPEVAASRRALSARMVDWVEARRRGDPWHG